MTKLILLFFVVAIPFSSYGREFDPSEPDGGVSTGGGDLISCLDPVTKTQVLYSLDFVLKNRLADRQGPRERKYPESILNRFNKIDPGYERSFQEFLNSYGQFHSANSNRHWIPGNYKLADLKDERISEKIPAACRDESGKPRIIQSVVFEQDEFGYSYYFDRELIDQLKKESPYQFSYIMLHEWLRDVINKAENIRLINFAAHSHWLETAQPGDFDKLIRKYGTIYRGKTGAGSPPEMRLGYYRTKDHKHEFKVYFELGDKPNVNIRGLNRDGGFTCEYTGPAAQQVCTGWGTVNVINSRRLVVKSEGVSYDVDFFKDGRSQWMIPNQEMQIGGSQLITCGERDINNLYSFDFAVRGKIENKKGPAIRVYPDYLIERLKKIDPGYARSFDEFLRTYETDDLKMSNRRWVEVPPNPTNVDYQYLFEEVPKSCLGDNGYSTLFLGIDGRQLENGFLYLYGKKYLDLVARANPYQFSMIMFHAWLQDVIPIARHIRTINWMTHSSWLDTAKPGDFDYLIRRFGGAAPAEMLLGKFESADKKKSMRFHFEIGDMPSVLADGDPNGAGGWLYCAYEGEDALQVCAGEAEYNNYTRITVLDPKTVRVDGGWPEATILHYVGRE